MHTLPLRNKKAYELAQLKSSTVLKPLFVLNCTSLALPKKEFKIKIITFNPLQEELQPETRHSINYWGFFSCDLEYSTLTITRQLLHTSLNS